MRPLPLLCIFFILMVVGCNEPSTTPDGHASAADQTGASATPAADNSARNADNAGNQLTPLDQGENPQALAIVQAIRRALVADGQLSTNAKNIKIIANNQMVTLRGPVADAHERDRIVDIAKAVPGVEHITNQLDVADRH